MTIQAAARSVAIAVLGVLCGCASTPETQAAPGAAVDFGPLADTVEAERLRVGAPGVAVVVVHDGRVAFSRGFGTRAGSDVPIATSTLFRVSSIAKTWTAIAILKLVEQGRLSLDSKVVDVIPGFALKDSPPETASLTLRHLLSHRSGIFDGAVSSADLGGTPDDALARWVASDAFRSTYYFMTPPNDTFNYTNVGFSIAGRMAEVVAGKPYRDLVRETVWAPLAMSRIVCTPEEIDRDGDFTQGRGPARNIVPADDWAPAAFPSGAGSACHASADDIAKLARFLLQGDTNVLSENSLAAMKEPSSDAEAPWVAERYHGWRYGFGLVAYDGIVIDGAYHPMRILGHEGDGRGYVGTMFTVPERKLAFIALANANEAYFDDSFAHALKLVGLPPAAAMPTRGVDASQFAGFTGTYFEPRVLKDITVREADGKLFADISGLAITGRELTPEHGRGFELRDVKSTDHDTDRFVRFLTDDTGKVDRIRNRYWVARRVDASH